MDIQKVMVVGSGLMGSGIAQVCAQAGLDVLLHDVFDEALQKAVKNI
ncbi:MAG: 3-hydroxybutyryl-CoA dehydrogenase, partial [Deltaproteobacteria bacterium]